MSVSWFSFVEFFQLFWLFISDKWQLFEVHRFKDLFFCSSAPRFLHRRHNSLCGRSNKKAWGSERNLGIHSSVWILCKTTLSLKIDVLNRLNENTTNVVLTDFQFPLQLRPPQPAIYIFLLDISFNAIESRYLNLFCERLSSVLERLPGDARTQISFIAYDSAVHFFQFETDWKMMTVADIEGKTIKSKVLN